MNNLNKQIVIATIISLSVAGISYASVLSQYGSIIGTANVSGPEFYIGSTNEETLLINEKPDNCEDFGITGTYRTFKTKEFNGVNFNYVPKVEFSIRAKVATTTPQDLTLSFGYYDSSDANEEDPRYLYSETFTINNEMKNYTSSLVQGSKMPTQVKRFFYEFKKGCKDCDYTINKCEEGFYTKVKLDKENGFEVL